MQSPCSIGGEPTATALAEHMQCVCYAATRASAPRRRSKSASKSPAVDLPHLRALGGARREGQLLAQERGLHHGGHGVRERCGSAGDFPRVGFRFA